MEHHQLLSCWRYDDGNYLKLFLNVVRIAIYICVYFPFYCTCKKIERMLDDRTSKTMNKWIRSRDRSRKRWTDFVGEDWSWIRLEVDGVDPEDLRWMAKNRSWWRTFVEVAKSHHTSGCNARVIWVLKKVNASSTFALHICLFSLHFGLQLRVWFEVVASSLGIVRFFLKFGGLYKSDTFNIKYTICKALQQTEVDFR